MKKVSGKDPKFQIKYEDDDSISIWKYDLDISTYGPIEVEYKWKKSYNPWEKTKKKTLSEIVNDEKKKKKLNQKSD